jgi:energy-coupling factor transporter ATP-binding protein EcfA2
MRLHELHINNFKFFPKQDPKSPLLKIDGKNLLVYGENGSGKSTIYWALYTLLESSFKSDNLALSKYFQKGGEHGLVNIYAPTNHKSHVKAVLKEAGQPDVNYYLDGEKSVIESVRSDSAIRESGMASDFINYRVIFRLHNLKHSKENNLFKWFEDDIFPYIIIASIDSTKSVDAALKELKEGPPRVKDFDEIDRLIFSNPAMQYHLEEAVRKDYRRYQRYERAVKKWNTKLKAYLQSITTRANQILSQDFKQTFEIKLDYTISKFNVTADTFRWEDPIIELKIPVYNGKRNAVKRPHSFLNEAKWTSIGISIRLAIIEDWTNRPFTAQLKALMIDDMLLSLDMSNRDAVLNILLDRYVNDYQLILLTHDRYFFELAKGKINARNKSSDWIKLEMYEEAENGKTRPLILKSKTNLERAKSFFKQKEFSASANHLRRATECFVHEYVPKNKQYDRRFEPLKLSALINRSRALAKLNGLPASLIRDLDLMRTHIFNPGSHHDVYTPVFQADLKEAIRILEEVSRLTNIEL